MWTPFKSKAAAPKHIPSDEIIDLHWLDDNVHFRHAYINLLCKFDVVLDPERLRRSLEKLASRDDGWRKLGARLRLNEHGKLEYHIPRHFSPERPPLNYSHVEYDIDAADHPIASQLPKASTSPAIVADARTFQPLMRSARGPEKLADYIYADIPQLALHVVSFRDITLVGLTWPHTLLDATGQKDFLKAWTLILRGKDEEVAPPCGLMSDPFAEFGRAPKEPYKHAARLLTRAQRLVFISRFVWDSMRYAEEERVVCLPGAYIKALRDLASADIAGSVNPFVSEGDVLCAWLARLSISNQLRGSDKTTVSIVITTDIRSQLVEAGHLPPGRPYVSNAVMHMFSFLPQEEIVSKPLGHVAAAIRRSMAELRTREQVEAYVAMLRKSFAETTLPPLFGDATTQQLGFSNWTKQDFFELDFSAAVAEKDNMTHKAVKPTYVQYLPAKGTNTRNTFSIMGKDAEGNYWVSGVLTKGVWDRIASLSKGSELKLRQSQFGRASL